MEVKMNNGKKQTNGQLERRIKNALIHIDKTKETQSIYFDDKGLRLTVNDEYAIIGTGAHQHVFDAVTTNGISRPYLYTKRLLEIALANEPIVTNQDGGKSWSYAKLFEILKAKEDRTEYNICWYTDLWLYNIFAPLYEIDESETGTFFLYETYMHNIARQSFLLSEHKEDVTNKSFVNAVIANEKEFLDGIEERVLIKAKTDEERLQEEVAAMQERETEKAVEEQTESK